MAEAGAPAAILGIINFGIHLVGSLYQFGTNVANARNDTDRIARHIDFYANALDVLQDRIEGEERILSPNALDLIDELEYQSNKLFKEIENLLPDMKHDKTDVTFWSKIKWNFQKSQVTSLVSELDYLQNTVHLLATIIFTARKVRSYRRRRKQDVKDEEFRRRDLQTQLLKAQHAVFQHRNGVEKLQDLSARSNTTPGIILMDHDDCDTELHPQIQGKEIICRASSAFTELQKRLASYTDPSDSQRDVLEQTAQVLRKLVQDWTTVDLLNVETQIDENEDQPINKPTHESAKARERPKEAGSPRSRSRPVVTDERDETLPPGWSKLYDPSSKCFYYHNYETNNVQWELPKLSNTSTEAKPKNMRNKSASADPLDSVSRLRLDQRSRSPSTPYASRPDIGPEDNKQYSQNIRFDNSRNIIPPADLFNQFFRSPHPNVNIQQPGYGSILKDIPGLHSDKRINLGADAPKLLKSLQVFPSHRSCPSCSGRGTKAGIQLFTPSTKSACHRCNGNGVVRRNTVGLAMSAGDYMVCPLCRGVHQKIPYWAQCGHCHGTGIK